MGSSTVVMLEALPDGAWFKGMGVELFMGSAANLPNVRCVLLCHCCGSLVCDEVGSQIKSTVAVTGMQSCLPACYE